MHTGAEEIAAVREEIMDLLRQQMEALDSPLGLTDARLTECYDRQARVQELREKLQALSNQDIEAQPVSDRSSQSRCRAARAMPASLDAAANV